MANNEARVAIRVDDQTRTGFDSFKRSMSELESGFGRLRTIAAGAFAVLAGGGVLRQVAEAGIEAEKSQARLEAVLKATGYAAGLTKKQLDELNDELVGLTEFDDESIRNAQAQLLKFGEIAGDNFNRALKAAADFAAFTGTDLPSAAQQIGAALSNQEGGLGRLERQFGSLTKSEEEAIKGLQDVGDVAGAQAAKLAVLESRIGGTAEKMNAGLVKASGDLKKNWGELLEEFARTDGVVGGTLNAALGRTAELLKNLRAEVGGTKTELSDFLDKLARAPGPFGIVGAAGKGALALARAGQAPGPVATGTIQPSAALAAQLGEEAQARARQRALDAAAEAAKKPAGKGGAERATSRSVDDYATRISAAVGRAIETSDVVKAKEFADVLAELDRLFFEGKLPVEIYSSALEQLTRATDTTVQAVDELAALMARTSSGIQAEASRLTDVIDEAFFSGRISEKQQQELLAVANGYKSLGKDIEDASDAGRDFALTMQSAFSDAIVSGKGFSDVLRGIGKDIAQLIFRTATKPLWDKLEGVVGGIFKGIFGSAQGNVFGPAGLQPFAMGGVVARPTVFPFAGGVGLMGEAGPEAILPLKRGPTGRLGVESSAAAQPVNVVINASAIDARNLDQMLTARAETIAAAVTKAVNARGRRGPLG